MINLNQYKPVDYYTWIQCSWLWLTVIYYIFSTFYPERYVSSLLISVGGLLLSAYYYSIREQEDEEKVYGTILTIVTGSIFLSLEAFRSFTDYLAGVMAALTAITSTFLIVLFRHKRLYYRVSMFNGYFVFVTSLVSMLTLHSTIIIRDLIVPRSGGQELLIIAPHATSILWAIYISWLFYKQDRRIKIPVWRTAFVGILYAVGIGFVGYFLNEVRLIQIDSPFELKMMCVIMQSLIIYLALMVYLSLGNLKWLWMQLTVGSSIFGIGNATIWEIIVFDGDPVMIYRRFLISFISFFLFCTVLTICRNVISHVGQPPNRA